MRIVVVSNTTMDPLARNLAGHEVVVSGVGDLIPWLIDPSSPAADPSTGLVLVCPDGDSLVPPLADGAALLDELLAHVDGFAARHPGTPVAVTTLLLDSRGPLAHADATTPAGRFAARARWEAGLAEMAAGRPNVNVVDLRGLAERHGAAALVNDSYWYLGRIRFSPLGFSALAQDLAELVAGLANQARKVLVLDLDNTLWGGVVGEEGVGGIGLGEDGPAKCHRDFQRQVKALREAGTLLAVVSKNDPEIVDEVFDTHPMMVLRREDVMAISASWDDKATRIATLADTLGLGLDAFVFIDDNPVERELVRRALPAVAVPEFPDRVERLPRWFVEEVVPAFFPRARVLDEDRHKTGQYQARQARRELETADLATFLATLDIRLTFRADDLTLVPRISQLTQKTNQFNLTTERLSTAEVQALVASPDHVVLACDYADRFGQEGTIGVAFVDVASGELANLLLSCRVLGRGVEDALLGEAARRVSERGHGRLRARFVPTARNGVAAEFLGRNGFALEPAGAGGLVGEWDLDLVGAAENVTVGQGTGAAGAGARAKGAQ